ncbi:unnamed protein product [Closterium sp. NIES-54]
MINSASADGMAMSSYPIFESTAASALNAKLLDFAATCCLDYANALIAESESASPPSVGGECAHGTDVLEDRQEDFECLAAVVPRFASMLLAPEGDPDAPDIPTPRSYAETITGPYSSQWQTAMDAEMASWKSTGTYVDAVPPSQANIVDGMWIFRVKRPPGSPHAFKARYIARGFSQRQRVDYFQTFSPTTKTTTVRVLLHVAAQRDYELHSLDFSTAFLLGSLHEEIWLRRPPGFTGSFPAGTQWSLWRPVYGLRQAPREWHNTLRTTLAALGFTPLTADPSLFLRTDTSLLPLYFLVYVDDLVFATADTEALSLVKSELQKRHTCTDLGPSAHVAFSLPQPTPLSTSHSLSAPPSDESVEPSGPYPELVGCLMYLMTCTRPDLAYPLSLLARYVAPGRHRKVHWDAAKMVLRYLCSTSGIGPVLGGRGLVFLTGHADASWASPSPLQPASHPCSPRAALAATRATPGGPPSRPYCPASRPLRPSRSPCSPVHRLLLPACCPPTPFYCLPCSLHCPASARPACCAAMASLRVLAFDHEARPIQFDTWLDDLQLYLLSDSRDRVSLFDHTSGAAPAPPATADSATRSQWLTRNAAARLANRNHLPLAECAHFGQHRTAQALYHAGVARHSSPASAALGRLLLPYLFPELSAFAIVEDLVSHPRTSDARYHAAVPAEVLHLPPCPLLHLCSLLLTSLVLRTLGLLLLVRSAAAARARVVGVVAVAAGVVVGAAVEVVEVVEVVAVVGVVAGVGALVEAVVAAVGVAVVAAVGVVAVGLELLIVEVLAVARGISSCVGARPHRPSSFMSGFLSVGRLGVVVAARMSFAWVTVLVRHAGSLTPSTATSPALTTLGAQSLVTMRSAAGESCLGLELLSLT